MTLLKGLKMNILRKISTSLALFLGIAIPLAASAQQHKKVLIVMSSAHHLDIRDGKKYETGYFLDELAIPLRKLIDAGYTPVFANPKGDTPTLDSSSNNKMFFGGNETTLAETLKFVAGIKELQHPKTLSSILSEGTKDYAGILIPGGHAPMQDLLKDKTLGKILSSFHTASKPTGLICHGPIALLSTIADPAAFQKAMIAGDYEGASKLAVGWPYAGYRMTVFSTGEEQKTEGASQQLGGFILFYPADALAQAGAHVDRVAAWQSNVIEDRELVTAQQPFSSDAFGDAFVAKLKANAK